MALEIRKKERETSQNLVRRFTRSVQQSGILVRARKTRFRVRKKSDDMQKKAALRRIKMKKEYEVLKKLGKERE
jgi:ribosomal protein S21